MRHVRADVVQEPLGDSARRELGSRWAPSPSPRTRAFLTVALGLSGAVLAGGVFWALTALLLFSAFASGGDSAGWVNWAWGGLLAMPLVGAVASGLWCGYLGYTLLGGEVKSRSRRIYRMMGAAVLGMLVGTSAALFGADGDIAPPLRVYIGLVLGALLGVRASARESRSVEGA